jgi:hypothetical protein
LLLLLLYMHKTDYWLNFRLLPFVPTSVPSVVPTNSLGIFFTYMIHQHVKFSLNHTLVPHIVRLLHVTPPLIQDSTYPSHHQTYKTQRNHLSCISSFGN